MDPLTQAHRTWFHHCVRKTDQGVTKHKFSESGEASTGGSVFAMFHLDYISCALTVPATILLARKSWIGLLIATVNSLIVCAIALRTSQLGLIPANLICICIYASSMRSWLYGQTRPNRGQAPRQDSVAPRLRGEANQLRQLVAAKDRTSTLIPSMELEPDRTCLPGLG